MGRPGHRRPGAQCSRSFTFAGPGGSVLDRTARQRRLASVAAAAVVALLLASCDSTTRQPLDVSALVSDDSSPDTSSGGADALARGADALTADAPTGATTPGGPRRNAGPGTTSHSTGPRSGTTGDSTGGGGNGDDIVIGFHTSKDLQAAYTAFGAEGAEGDVTPKLEILIDWFNDHGGVAGHKIVPVFHATDPLNQQAQVACDDFTTDHHVNVVISGAVLPSINVPDCLAKKGVSLFWNYHYFLDQGLLEQYSPYLYQPFGISAERLAPALVDTLAAGDYFAGRGVPPATSVGILRYDRAEQKRFSENMLRPRLADRGFTVGDEVAVSPPPSAAAAPDTAAQIANAIMRFRRANVTHVIFVPTGGVLPFIFLSAAEAQQYRPRYAMTTLDIPYFVRDQSPTQQLDGALAAGWSPPSDVDHPDEPPGALRQQCWDLTASRTANRYCDALFLLDDALGRVSGVDAASVQAGMESLGDVESVFALAERYAPGRHDGASAVRLLAFVNDCECWRYTGDLRPIG